MLRRDIPKFEGAVFDLDGTLLDSLHIWQQIDIDFLAARGFEVPDNYMQAIQPLGPEATALYTIERFGLDEDPEDIQREWFDMAYHAYRDRLELKPGAGRFVSVLHDMGIPIAIASSSDRLLIDAAVKRTGLSDMVREIVTVKDVARGKGFPDIYLYAAEKIGISPDKCCVFEDIPEGIRAARTAGCSVIGIYDSINKVPFPILAQDTDLCVYSFEELLGEF